MHSYDVVTLGEALVDFVPIDGAIPGRFEALPGGAPTNVACGLAKLGDRVAALARIGRDPLGRCVLGTMERLGVDTQFVQQDPERPTTVTVVMPGGEDMLRYIIYRSDSADGALAFEDIPDTLWENTRILHLGTLVMSSPTARETSLRCVEAARRAGCKISLDVNLRIGSWRCEADMVREALGMIERSDIVKLTRDEAEVLGLSDKDLGSYTDKIILLTDGPNGAEVIAGEERCRFPAIDVEVRDVTGGGDAFVAGFLHYYLRSAGRGRHTLVREGVRFATCASSVAIQHHGAIESMPTLGQVEQLVHGTEEIH